MSVAAPYTRMAMLLHWLTFALCLLAAGLAISMVDMPLSLDKLKFYSWHKWTGVTIFLLTCLRLLWRLRHPPPPLPAALPAWQKALAGASHALLYLLLLAIPITGWLYSSAEGVQTVYLRVVPLPDLLDKDEALAGLLRFAHVGLNLCLLGLVLLHVAAVVEHQVMRKLPLLQRMLPFPPVREKT